MMNFSFHLVIGMSKALKLKGSQRTLGSAAAAFSLWLSLSLFLALFFAFGFVVVAFGFPPRLYYCKLGM